MIWGLYLMGPDFGLSVGESESAVTVGSELVAGCEPSGLVRGYHLVISL